MPQHRGKRERLATNLYRDQKGIAAIARVPGCAPRELRFAHGTSHKAINKALDEKRAEMRAALTTRGAIAKPGTVGKLVVDYLSIFKNDDALRVASTLLQPWVTAIGARQTRDITKADILGVILDWEERARAAEADRTATDGRPKKHGYAASTINHRRRELAKAWDAMLPDAKNVVRQARKSPEPEPLDRGLPMKVLDAIIDEVPDKSTGRAQHMPNKTKARLRAMLWTGFAPAMLKIVPLHGIRLERLPDGSDWGDVKLPPRKKGKGAPGVTIPLFPEGVRAMRGLLRAFAIGPFSQSSVWKTFQRAVKAYKARMARAGTPAMLPPDVKPYDLRHSFLSWVSDQKDDPQLVQFLAQHLRLETTTRYTKSAIERRAARFVRGESEAPGRGPRTSQSSST